AAELISRGSDPARVTETIYRTRFDILELRARPRPAVQLVDRSTDDRKGLAPEHGVVIVADPVELDEIARVAFGTNAVPRAVTLPGREHIGPEEVHDHRPVRTDGMESSGPVGDPCCRDGACLRLIGT